MSKESMTYRSAGVDIDRGNETVERIKPLVEKTRRPEQLGGIGGFGALFQLDLNKFKQPVLVSGTDGVGTKLAVAQAAGRHQTIGIDAVAMCVNDILVSGAEPLFFLDYLAVGNLDPQQAEDIVAGVAEGCFQAGCALAGGETAEMPGFYKPGEYDIAGFAVGAVDKEKMIDGSHIVPGDVLVGIASSGLHSNGFSLTRKIVFDAAQMNLNDYVEAWGCTVADELLKPTQIYVKLVQELLAEMPKQGVEIKGMSHITGGGLLENPNRVLPKGMALELNLGAWPVLPVFKWLQEKGKVETMEMLRTYNMGIGFCFYVDANQAPKLIDGLKALGKEAWVIGQVVAGGGDVKVKGSL